MIIDVGKRVFEKVCDFFVGNSLDSSVFCASVLMVRMKAWPTIMWKL